jgi:histidyl-tRNA synthetase
MNIPIAPGVFDILPQELKEPWRSTHLWIYLESAIRKIAAEYAFQEIRTPIFERTELFKRSVGESSDIVSKEMYEFEDRGGRAMSLRPEGTAPVMRSFVENQMHQTAPIHKLFYIGPMFRYERSQAGRYRQHHQFGAEVIGTSAPEQDVECIDLLYTLYTRLGLKNLQVNINSIGDSESRLAFRKSLVEYFRKHYTHLSEDSKIRLDQNPLRILDSKDPNDKKIAMEAPIIFEFLNEECRDHFMMVQKLLHQLRIPFQINPLLVRGLDYYNKTVFEITAGELGAQNSIAGGGRYDGLLKTLEGPDLPAIGFGTGLERIIQSMLKQEIALPNPIAPEIFLISMGDEAKQPCFSLLQQLRHSGISAQMDFSQRKLNKLMQYANQIGAAHVIVIGENELKTETVEMKNMSSGEKRQFPLQLIASILGYERQSSYFIKQLENLSKPFSNPLEADFFINKLKCSISETTSAVADIKNALHKMQKLFD